MTIFLFSFGIGKYAIIVECNNKYFFKFDERNNKYTGYDVNKTAFLNYLKDFKKYLIWVGIKNRKNKWVDLLYRTGNVRLDDYISHLKFFFNLPKHMLKEYNEKIICNILNKIFNEED